MFNSPECATFLDEHWSKAIKDLPQLEVNIADPISLEEQVKTKKAKNRKSPGSNGIPIELYKHLDNENLTEVLNILNCYAQDPNYDNLDWRKMTLKLLAKKVISLSQKITDPSPSLIYSPRF